MPYKVNQPYCYSRIQLLSFPDSNGERYPVDEMRECHIRDVSFYINRYQNWKHIKIVRNTTQHHIAAGTHAYQICSVNRL